MSRWAGASLLYHGFALDCCTIFILELTLSTTQIHPLCPHQDNASIPQIQPCHLKSLTGSITEKESQKPSLPTISAPLFWDSDSK